MMESEPVKRDGLHHCNGIANQRGAKSLVELMNNPTHSEKKLNQIIFEYVRCQGEYYTDMVMGGKSGTEGNTVIKFVRQLQDAGKLADNCQLTLTRCVDGRWATAMGNYKKAFGDAINIPNNHNALFEVCVCVVGWGVGGSSGPTCMHLSWCSGVTPV